MIPNYQQIRAQESLLSLNKHINQLNDPQNHLFNNVQTPLSNPQSFSTKSSNKSSGHYIYDDAYDRKNLKRLLYEDYQTQIRIKKEREERQKNRQLQKQKDFVKKSQQLSVRLQWEDLERKLMKQKYISEDYHQKQQDKKQAKLKQQNEKWRQKQQFLNKKVIDKRAIFREFYSNLDKGMRQKQNMYLQLVMPGQSQRERNKQKLAQAGLYSNANKYSNLQREIELENKKKTQQYRGELIRQKLQKEAFKRHNSERKLDPLASSNADPYFYHPILNPINLGVDPDNKYLVGQIRKNVQRLGTTNSRENFSVVNSQQPLKQNLKVGLTSLARNGSQILS